MHETIGRFSRWGLVHGPLWGVAAALIGGIPLSRLVDFPVTEAQLISIGLIVGLIAGPFLAIMVGVTCMAADHAPRWLLDAPDYVAVLTVLAVIGLAAWPLLSLVDASASATLLGVVLLASAPTIDAARSAPQLLRPQAVGGAHRAVRTVSFDHVRQARGSAV